MATLENLPNIAWHARPAEEVLAALESDPQGLGPDEAAVRLQRFGPNNLPAQHGPGWIRRILRQFNNVLIYVLLGAALITLLLGYYVDSAVILAVVVINAVIGFLQEGKAERAMDAIREMLAPMASVLRGGVRRTVPGEELVPGDIVLLGSGDRVPADLRLLQTRSMSVQEAILTGESLPDDKDPAPIPEQTALGDRSSMAYSGTLVTSGQGKGVVVATGGETEIGRISGMIEGVETLTTPLLEQMAAFSKWLTAFILVVAGLLLAFGYFVQQHDFSELFMAIVGLSVAAIPEGLPAVLTITLAIGVQTMARRNAIVRRLPAIETLGSVSVICTDKTGTLTRNEMAVQRVVTSSQFYSVEGEGYQPAGSVVADGGSSADPALRETARAALLCNDAALHEKDGVWVVEGDPMEGALLAFAERAGLDRFSERHRWTRTDAIPFDAALRFMATMQHDHEGNACIYVKGAPEQVLSMCATQEDGHGAPEPLDETYWRERADDCAAEGQRVLALARRDVSQEQTVLEQADVEQGLTMLGLVGLIDPPRPEAIAAVEDCRRAGIRVKMITGDHAGTAAAIGRQIGLQNPNAVLTGKDLYAMDDAQLATRVVETDIFARTSPEHKLRLVMALQSQGLTVAMTGDGVNDAPALKRADAGIAMGRKGSAAAKEAAQIVLADDNFASIAAAVREGRTVYDNLKKVISYTIPTSAGEAFTIVVALLFGMTLPVTAVQILWINLITEVSLGLALAFEPTEENTMRRPPRPRRESLLNGVLVWHIVWVSFLFLCGAFGIFAYAVNRGYSIELSRTIAMNTLVVMEIFHLFFIRNIYGTSLTLEKIAGTKVVWLCVLVTTAGQFAITYLPPLQAVFQTESVPFVDGLIIVGVGIALFALLEIEKQIRLRIGGMSIAGQAFER